MDAWGDTVDSLKTGFGGLWDAAADIGAAMAHNGARLADPNLEAQVYGSGPVVVAPGLENLNVPGCPGIAAEKMEVKEVVEHQIPLLMVTDTLTAIIGMGPGLNPELPHRLHHQLGVERFAFCFPPDVAEDGLVIWNEDDPRQAAGRGGFTEVEM